MQDDRIILLKHSPPSPPPGFVQRTRLADVVAQGLSGRLILINAPVGYGKTSLLASIAQEWSSYSCTSTSTYLSWYALDPSDNDVAVFIDGLVESVRQLFPDFGRTVRAALQGTTNARVEAGNLMSIFLEELRKTVDGWCVIVLDDFQLITERSIVDALELALRDKASPLRLIISTQTDPKLYLSPLRSQDSLTELGKEELRFTPVEVRELLLSRVGERATQRVVAEAVRMTGGWPSAANLVALIMAKGRENSSFERLFPTRHGYARLVREVVSVLPTRHREAVLRLSLLRYFDPESCREGLGLTDAKDLLQEIQAIPLPVTKPSNRASPFLFDPLFRNALEQELAQRLLPNEYQKLKGKVASYYSDKGAIDDAIRRFLEAGEAGEAANVLERAIEPELERGHIDLVLGWLRALPAPVRCRHPRLLVHEARLSLAREKLDDARVLLVAAQSELETAGDDVGMGQLLGSWASLHILEGRYQDARRSAEQALVRFSGDNPADIAEILWLQSRSLELMGDLVKAFYTGSRGLLAAEQSGRQKLAVRAMLQLGRLAYLRGDFVESLALNGRAVQRSALLGTEMLTLGNAGGTAGLAYLERGQAQEAAIVAARSLEAGRQHRDVAVEVRAGLAISAACERIDQKEYALERLSQALTLSATLPSHWPERTMALQTAAGSLYRQGKRKDARSAARQALETAMVASNRVLMDRCRMMVAAGETTGRLPTALVRIHQLCCEFKKSDSRHWLSGSLQLLSMGCWRLHLKWLARSSLTQSLELAAKESYVGTPIGLPEAKKLLALAVREGIVHEKAGNLLGVNLVEAREALIPLLASKKPNLKKRALETLEGIEAGMGRAPEVRLLWPGLTDGDDDSHGEVLLYAFGQFEAFIDGDAVEWPSDDARNLAAYLLVNRGRPVTVEVTMKALWPNSEPSHANVRLHVALYRIRETLGSGYPPVDPTLDGKRTLLWDVIGCSTDVEAFREGTDRVRKRLEMEKLPRLSALTVSLLEDVVDLYQGAFMANVDFDWCKPMRTELRRQWLWAIHLLVFHYMAVGDWEQAIRRGRRSLIIDPLQEEIVRQMMICYYRLGDRDAILKQYQDLKVQLAKRRGVWLSEETRNLRLQLLGS